MARRDLATRDRAPDGGPEPRQPADVGGSLARIDAALMDLRHLWHAPGARQPTGGDGVELSTIWVVEALSRVEDGLAITGLAAALDVAQSTGSRLVERAVAAGMVQRAPSPSDGRRVVLRPTPAGRALAAEARAFRAGYLHQLTHDWTDTERATFAALLGRFAHAAHATPPTTSEGTKGTP